MDLVEGRECGECSACCIVLPVDTPDFRKAPGMPCKHLRQGGGGCGYHEQRPGVCRNYHCAWRFLGYLDDTWRPDRSGVLIEFQDVDIPAGYEKRPAIRLGVIGDIETVFKKGFVNLVIQLLEMEVPTFLAVQGPLGYYPANTFLNDAMRDAVRSKDPSKVARRFADLLHSLSGFNYLPVSFNHTDAPDFGLIPHGQPLPLPG